MPAGFRRHLVGKTLINVFRCDITEIYALLASCDHTDIFINQPIKYYLNNGINLRPLTPHIMPCYTHTMAIVTVDSMASLQPICIVVTRSLCSRCFCSRHSRSMLSQCHIADADARGSFSTRRQLPARSRPPTPSAVVFEVPRAHRPASPVNHPLAPPLLHHCVTAAAAASAAAPDACGVCQRRDHGCSGTGPHVHECPQDFG